MTSAAAVMALGVLTRILVVLLAAASVVASSLLADADAQPTALEMLDSSSVQPTEADVLLSLDRGWFDVAKKALSMMRTRGEHNPDHNTYAHEQLSVGASSQFTTLTHLPYRRAGEPVASLANVRASATRIRDQATEVINLMRTGANAEETVVTTAFQWAQRPDSIHLNVKFSSRIDGPVTCLNVDNERIEFGNDTVFFEGVGRQKPKTFRLNLTLHDEILPENSSWSFTSVGRLSITLAKARRESWPRLLQGKAKPKNMHLWYDMQQRLDEEVKKEKEAAKAAREAATKASSTPPAPPTSQPSDAAKEAVQPPSPQREPAPPSPPAGKTGKSKVKKADSGKQAKKKKAAIEKAEL